MLEEHDDGADIGWPLSITISMIVLFLLAKHAIYHMYRPVFIPLSLTPVEVDGFLNRPRSHGLALLLCVTLDQIVVRRFFSEELILRVQRGSLSIYNRHLVVIIRVQIFTIFEQKMTGNFEVQHWRLSLIIAIVFFSGSPFQSTSCLLGECSQHYSCVF